MNLDDLIIVSVDDHVVEPPHLFERYVPQRYRHLAPRVKRSADGSDVWSFDGRELPIGHVGATVGFRHGAEVQISERGEARATFDDLRPGCWDIHERIKDMDLNGQVAGMCFPQFPRFAGQVFTEASDKQMALIMLQAYNDWHVDEWAGTYPGRMIPLGILPMWDADLTAKEVYRLAGMGCRAVTFSISPYRLGLPSLHTRAWDPLWRACSETGTVVCMHLGSDSHPPFASPDAPHNVQTTLVPMSTIYGATDLIWSPVLRRFPVKIALSEGGIGWIPWLLERIDHSLEAHSFTGQSFDGRRPSDVFREHIITCFISDRHGVQSRYEIGIDSICVEVDYPHADSTWPHSPERMMAELDGIPEEEIHAITHGNAIRHFGFDPFEHRVPSDCTVGSLRRKSAASTGAHGAVLEA